MAPRSLLLGTAVASPCTPDSLVIESPLNSLLSPRVPKSPLTQIHLSLSEDVNGGTVRYLFLQNVN